ncbi:MAG: flagellar hook-basal body complex protein, partial [Butyrivibrio sp.]
MMRALYSGVAGLKSHQTKMDVIGNNIANVNTIGFKSQSVTFSDVLYQTTQSASGANEETGAGGTNAKQIGLGSIVSAISTKVAESGGTQATNNPFDLMINGDSMFIVNNNGVNYFTKAGNFAVDTRGTLVTSQGYAVMGWDADEQGNIVKSNVQQICLYSPENQYAAPRATTATNVSGNINKEDESFSSVTGTISTNITFYDTLGYKYQATIDIAQAADYEYTISVSAVTCDGKPLALTDDELKALIDAGDTTITFNDATGAIDTGSLITFKATELGIASLAQDVTIDFSQLTCMGTDTALVPSRGDLTGVGAGRTVGNLSGVSIQKD